MSEFILLATVAIIVLTFLIWVPVFKPWFGFRKPKNHRGRWFQ